MHTHSNHRLEIKATETHSVFIIMVSILVTASPSGEHEEQTLYSVSPACGRSSSGGLWTQY